MEPSTINITEYLNQGKLFREKIPYPLLSQSLYTGTAYIFLQI